ncbi:MAG: hypothetical protein A3B99_04285 [Candidatus Yanofskybacteria bacterium RIFCSPHIGHO2_02_FULL_44_12b]|uniref:ABC transporter ATP-binding protein n=2 Tax=Candidatus Yanofskyibacteriota TaxID=1752733 RepID=A0A1F8GMY4_9BACT|nr:MAG: ABC transporter related protein [Candidatus Yanofskybacteria bacterium GW2011_GWA2_44_9]OGN04603.1 MAG: hypothetical protein A2659_00555 [Candidatus Yanofskybacteria bacterium RIFCSPHIGHO2_01_FULL_44_24]OGN15731.1 MAG: hypothetical protein A3B99_04285 [Candidatus Yanofskybacteria bacterium RIFCSPHIGHO2_02_FULL_44_12b]OGN26787.1 MAG: hypothetical protein A2925_04370 [Candidatus Yanofskybacteria bacterium RIFCSPLOWO2_01_FULL_44_22]
MSLNTFQKIKYIFVLSKDLIGPYKSGLILTILLGFLNGLAGSIGIGVVIPLFSLFSNVAVEGTDFITRNVAWSFSFLHIPLTPAFLIAFMVALFALKALTQFFSKYNTEKLVARLEEDLRKDLFEKTLKADWPSLMEQKTGYLERVLLFDISNAASLLNQVSSSILIATSFIAYAFVAFKISSTVTLMTMGFGGILFFLFKPLFFKTRKISEEISATFKEVAHHVGENIIGAKIVKATSTEDRVISKGLHYFDKLRRARIKMSFYTYSLGQSLEPTGIAFVGLLFIFTYRTPEFNIAAFGVVVYLIQKMFSFIQSAQSQMQGFNGLIPYLESTAEYKTIAKNSVEVNRGTDDFEFNKSLEFKGIEFSYPRSGEILKNLNFSIQKGEVVGIIGPSGVGKTTVVDLLLRLLEPDGGQILLDGKNILKIDLKAWRNNIGYVPQDIFLLNDTIENNVKFYDETVTHEEIIKAIKMASIYDFVSELPDRFQTVVGERGIELSGGQRQRIVLARALARNPKILVLDEATSSVDTESEALIQKAISGLKGRVTILVIAHRLSTITNADKLMVLEEGRIIEEGRPEELLKNKSSHFYKAYHIKD